MKKHIDESDLIHVTTLYSANKSNVFGNDSFNDSIKSRESKAENYPNVKFGRGHYKVDHEIYMSIWAYKNEYGFEYNSNHSNYNDAIDINKMGFARDIIIVTTNSPYYPTVRGYLRDKLDKFYAMAG